MIFAIGLVTLSGCLKDEDGVYHVSAVRALNAVPGSEHLDIGLNESWLNYDLQTREVEDFAYRDTLPYKQAWPGTREVRVFEGGNITSGGLLAKGNVQFTPGQFYSIYVVGLEDDIELMVTEDDLSEPAAGKAKIRFINLSPDAPALDFGVESADTLIASDIAFKEVKDFSAVDAGQTYVFSVFEHSGGARVHSFEFKPESGRIYTVWIRGMFDNEGNAELDFGHDMIVH
jgi:hypothetical protein